MSAPLTLHPDVSIAFLEQLRPGGPWVLVAITSDGPVTTITAKTTDEVRAFVERHGRSRNLYYSVNPVRTEMDSKPAKTDIAAIEFALSDLDPRADETAEQAKARYLEQINGEFEPKPTAVIDSGNGIQLLWRLQERIPLGEPVTKKDKDGKDELVFSSEDMAKIEDVEGRIKATMLRLGSKAGTQNIDRILRLPGTLNHPNAKKRGEGRTACETNLIKFNGVCSSLDAFPADTTDSDDEPTEAKSKDKKTKRKPASNEDPLEQKIRDGAKKGDRSEAVWFVVNEMLRRGYRAEAIMRVLLDRANGISEHVYDQSDPRDYAQRQVKKASQTIDFDRDKKTDRPFASPRNIRVGLLKLGVTVRYDQFADRTLLQGLPGFGPTLDDPAVNRIWLLLDERFHFRPTEQLMFVVIPDTARLNGFHPVLEYLNGLHWDGVPRLDKWLHTYAGAEDNEYTQAVGALTLIAAVRRIRQPGCKFDETLVLEQHEQGTDKSTALAILAVNEDWFTDEMPLNVEGKRVIEVLRGRWIVEAGELSGMRKADVEHVKALFSRQRDRARMAFGRLPIELPRQCIIVGTTNKSEYLRDTTGNRRFWPVLIARFDLEAMRRDRDQLWAEAAAREAKGESIRLRKELWSVAAEEQRQRLADDPFAAVLHTHLSRFKDHRIRAVDCWTILDLRGSQLTQDAYQRTAEAMKRIGWRRPNEAGTARFGAAPVAAYFVGDGKTIVTVFRDKDGLQVFEAGNEPPTGSDAPF